MPLGDASGVDSGGHLSVKARVVGGGGDGFDGQA